MAKAFFRSVRSGERGKILGDLGSIARKEIENTMDRKVKPALIKEHEKVVSNWKHRPGFAGRKYLRADGITVYVYPTGQHKNIWTYVDKGTRPHVITPKRASRLRFRTGYVAKTAPRARTISGGGKATGEVVFAKRVNHPGSEGRDFSGQIAEDFQPELRQEVENAFRRAVRRAR